jgi:hypothetical protein
MIKRTLVVAGVVTALAIPAGVAVAATTGPSPSPTGPTTSQPAGPGYGFGYGRGPMGGYGDPEDCPYYNSAEHQKWVQDRQQLMQQHRDQLRTNPPATTG